MYYVFTIYLPLDWDLFTNMPMFSRLSLAQGASINHVACHGVEGGGLPNDHFVLFKKEANRLDSDFLKAYS